MSAEVQELVARIASAFGDVPRPPDDALLHPDARDDNDIAALYGVSSWRDLDDATVEREYAALAFLAPEGFRHFLPAYLSFALRHPTSGAAAVGSVVYALGPLDEEPLASFMRSKFAGFSAAQSAAVVAFLEAMRPYEDVTDALAYWTSPGVAVREPPVRDAS